MGEERRHACANCGRDTGARAQNDFFPFCSQPCKLVDLGKWLDGTYRVPGPPMDLEDVPSHLRDEGEEDE